MGVVYIYRNGIYTRKMDTAKDLLKRAVELDSAQKYPEALICYEQGVQNLLRRLKGERIKA